MGGGCARRSAAHTLILGRAAGRLPDSCSALASCDGGVDDDARSWKRPGALLATANGLEVVMADASSTSELRAAV